LWQCAMCIVEVLRTSPWRSHLGGLGSAQPWGLAALAETVKILRGPRRQRMRENFKYVGLVRDVTAPVSAPRPRVSPSRTLRWINLPRTGEKSSLRYALQLMTPAAHARSPRLTLPRFRAHKIHQPRHILACRNSNPSIYYCLAHYKSFSSSSHDLFLFSLYFTLRARMEIE
jgi:hypothetical protein